jgi:hypothetical protein
VCWDQGGVDDRALAHRHAPSSQKRFDGLKDLLTQPVLLQQVAEGQNRRFIRNPITDQFDASGPLPGRHLVQGPSMARALREYHYCSK